MITTFYLPVLLLLAFSISTHAEPIDPFSISSASGCSGSGSDCTVYWANQINTSEMDAVQIYRSTGFSWLIRYNLHTPSAYTETRLDDLTGQYITSETPYSGHIWLEAPTELNLTGSNNFSVFVDQVDQAVHIQEWDNFGSSPLLALDFGMSSADALNGSASYYNSGTGWGDDPVTTSGDLILYNELATCVECGYELTLNLAGLDYSSGQLMLNSFLNPNQMLFSEDEFFGQGYAHYNNQFFVSSVPMPAAVWLFGSGLLMLAGFVGRKRHN